MMYFVNKGHASTFLRLLTRNIILVSLCIGFTACSSHQLKKGSNYQVNDDKENGLVVVSFTKSGIKDVLFLLQYRGIGINNKDIVGQITFEGGYDWNAARKTMLTTSKGSVTGKVVGLKLPAGQYEFYDLHIQDGYRSAEWDSCAEFSMPFVSQSSKTEYAGNVYVWSEDRPFESLSYQYFRSDERKRDIPLFREKFPNIGEIHYSFFFFFD